MKIHPDGTIEITGGMQAMIGVDGKLREVQYFEVEKYRTMGWKKVSNPRSTYYPEHDIRRGGTPPTDNILDNIDEGDLLPGKLL